MKPETEQAPAAVLRERILEAATACFTERGYDLTSIDDIALRSSLPAAEVRRHFADTGEIRAALISVWSEWLSAWMGYA